MLMNLFVFLLFHYTASLYILYRLSYYYFLNFFLYFKSKFIQPSPSILYGPKTNTIQSVTTRYLLTSIIKHQIYIRPYLN